jgi:hypothetical protein
MEGNADDCSAGIAEIDFALGFGATAKGEGEGEEGVEVRTQTQWLGNGRRKEGSPFGAAANILTLASPVVGGQSSWGGGGGCCALLAPGTEPYRAPIAGPRR